MKYDYYNAIEIKGSINDHYMQIKLDKGSDFICILQRLIVKIKIQNGLYLIKCIKWKELIKEGLK